MKIIDKIHDLTKMGLSKVQLRLTPTMKRAIFALVAFFVFCFLTYVLTWMYLFFMNNDVKAQFSLIQEWRAFLTLLVSGSMIAAVITILKIIFVDKDNDGIPDVLEEEPKRPCPPGFPPKGPM